MILIIIMQTAQQYQFYCLNSWDKTEQILRMFAQIDIHSAEEIDNRLVEIKTIASNLLGIVEITVDSTELKEMENIISYLDLEASNRLLKLLQSANFDEHDISIDEVLNQLRLLNATFFTPEGIREYSRDEMKAIFSQPEVTYNYIRLVYTLNVIADSLGTNDFTERVDMIKDFVFIEENSKEEEFLWEDLLIFTLMLRIVWRFINYASVEEQNILFSRYLYKSIVFGLPVRQYLENYFNGSVSFPEYVYKLNGMITLLEKSTEEVMVYRATEGKRESLASLIAMYNSHANKQGAEAFEKQEFINTLYIIGLKGRDKFIHWLRETLYIYTGAETAKLGENPDYRKRFELNEYEKQVSQLLDWFLDVETWPKIIEYYNHTEHAVSVWVLIKNCSLIFDLKKEKAAQRFLDFTSLLQQNNILKPHEFIIEFHEEDGQFHWNENLIV